MNLSGCDKLTSEKPALFPYHALFAQVNNILKETSPTYTVIDHQSRSGHTFSNLPNLLLFELTFDYISQSALPNPKTTCSSLSNSAVD